MVHNPHTPNHPEAAVGRLTPAMIRHTQNERGQSIITLPAGLYDCPDSLGTCIEMATGKPLTGGPLYIVGA
jgi:hypothetical protein